MTDDRIKYVYATRKKEFCNKEKKQFKNKIITFDFEQKKIVLFKLQFISLIFIVFHFSKDGKVKF